MSEFLCNTSMSNAIFGIPHIPEKEWEYSAAVHQLLIDFKKAYDVVRREVLYNVHLGFIVPMKHIRLIKTGLNEMQSEVWISKIHLLHSLTQRCFIYTALQLFFRTMPLA
jgi:hypothetical protein